MYKPGDLIYTLRYKVVGFDYSNLDGLAIPVTMEEPPVTTRILVVTDESPNGSVFICEGIHKQNMMAQWVRDALEEAGVDFDVKVRVVYPCEIGGFASETSD